MEQIRIAIIGGGVSGLATAYNLLDPTNQFQCHIDIYEATDYLGGNADTAKVDLGIIKEPLLANDNVTPERKHLIRMADLGVDDFNRDTYKRIVKIMKQIKFTDYRPLEDTACFFKEDGTVVLTADDALYHGTSNPDTAIDETLSETYNTFMNAAVVALQDEPDKYNSFTVERFVDEYIENAKSQAVEDIERMRDHLLYPRINAMYFVDDVTGPPGMPLRAVMQYYIIQEGFNPDNPPTPDRNYFIHGAQSWIDRLAEYLEDEYGDNLEILKGQQADVYVEENQVTIRPRETVSNKALEERVYDKVIMACHADDALQSIRHGLTQDLTNMLDSVRYTNSIAVAHTYAGVLSPDRNAWRTYNVLIRDGRAIHPYSMTYVMNRHQNDAAVWYEEEDGVPVLRTTDYNKAGMPQYFVTLNPFRPIPEKYVLRTPKGEQRKPAGYFKVAQPDQDRGLLPGWRFQTVPGEEEPVIGWFKHNVLDFDCLNAQAALVGLQGGRHANLYFVGGWTKGAGLHEECWDCAEEVSKKLIDDALRTPATRTRQTEPVH